MTYAWLMAPHEYEPDYDAYMLELDLLEASRANVATYDDWFPSLFETVDGAVLAEAARSADDVTTRL